MTIEAIVLAVTLVSLISLKLVLLAVDYAPLLAAQRKRSCRQAGVEGLVRTV